ncbi:MAG TPA: FAD-binding oxidoreductase [bacterium]|nr:FAD-binding oxidoreductase [bacterium]
MTVSVDDVAGRLERELGASWVSVDEPSRASHVVDGLRPHVVCRPAGADQIATVLRLCGEGGAAVTPWGGGTAVALGNVPQRVDVILRTDRLAALVEHDDANLTATVQGGMPISALNGQLAARRQFLAVDPPRPEAATIGGIVAANTNGPRRMSYGGVRDLVIGMRMVLAGGEPIKAGGKVVKNVAGYDMCKLFIGSLGTLGIITEVTFKMAPQPEAAATVLARGAAESAMRVVDDLFASVLQPTAITVSNVLAGLPAGAQALAVAAEGFTEAVDRHLRDIQTLAADAGMSVEVLRGRDHDALWARLRDFPADGSPAPPANGMIRLTVPLASVATALGAVAKLPGSVTWVAHAASGAVFLRCPAGVAPEAFDVLTRFAQAQHGHAVLTAAPPEMKRGRDVWGPPPQALGIMREIKRQFDPNNLLNPGRFVAFL